MCYLIKPNLTPDFYDKVTMILSCFYTTAACSCRGSGGGKLPAEGYHFHEVNFSKLGALYGCHTKGETKVPWV